jgi:DNA-binding MurR/RpiR family transcriptional regulator
MYRDLIRQNYSGLSRSYRMVADFVLGNYFDVAFMTAAEVGQSVGVDTTTVVRFAQRLGYRGYPDMLDAIRAHVRSEIYAARKPDVPIEQDVGMQFRYFLELEQQNLARTIMHNPPQRIGEIAGLLAGAKRFFLLGDSYAATAAMTVAQQLRQWGIPAAVVESEPVERAATLAQLSPGDLVIGLSASDQGADTARAMTFAKGKGVAVLAVVGDLTSPVNRAAQHVLYAPVLAPQSVDSPQGDVLDPLVGATENRLPSVAPLLAALFALIQVACGPDRAQVNDRSTPFDKAYRFITDGNGTDANEADSAIDQVVRKAA